MPVILDFNTFAARYCERQQQTPKGLLAILRQQRERYAPEGWALLECHMLDSSRVGELTILPYGPQNTFKAPPEGAISPRGLASDMSVVIAILLTESLPEEG